MVAQSQQFAQFHFVRAPPKLILCQLYPESRYHKLDLICLSETSSLCTYLCTHSGWGWGGSPRSFLQSSHLSAIDEGNVHSSAKNVVTSKDKFNKPEMLMRLRCTVLLNF